MYEPIGPKLSVILALLSYACGVVALSSTTNIQRIQVCQNKDCCRRFTTASAPLPQVLHNLLPPQHASRTEILASGCLSLCDKGPNVQLTISTGEQVERNGVSDHIQAAAELQALGVEIPPKLLAAVTVLEKAHKRTLAGSGYCISGCV